MLHQLLDVETVLVEDRAVPLYNCDDLEPNVAHQLRSHAADISATLNDNTGILWIAVDALEGLQRDKHASPSGRLRPPARAPQIDRLARYHGRFGVAHVHGVRVHDPRHRLLVRINVR